MENLDQQDALGEDELDAIVACYLQEAEQGRPPDRAAFIEQHPQFREGLEEFFSTLDQFERAAEPFRLGARPRSSYMGLLHDGECAAAAPSNGNGGTGTAPHYFGQYE